MNKTMKRLFSSVLVLVMAICAFGIVVSADTEMPVVTVREEDVTIKDNAVKKLVFNVKTPASVGKVKTTEIFLSWDSTVITPVAAATGAALTDTYINGGYITAAIPGFSFTISDPIMGDSTVTWTVKAGNKDGGYPVGKSGNRMGVNIVQTTTDSANYYDATSGMDFTSFYFKVNDGATVDANTFAIEKDYSTGSILDQLFNVPASDLGAITISTVNSGDLKYGQLESSNAEAVTFDGFPYGGTVEPTTPNVDGVVFEGKTVTYGDDATIATPDVSGIEGIASATVTYTAEDGSVVETPVNAGTYTATLTFAVTDETLYNVPAAKTATITINKKAVTYTVADATKKADEADPAFTGSFAEGDLVGDDTVADFEIKYTLEGTTINATVTNANYDVKVNAGTLTIDAVTAPQTAVEGVSELEINGKIYKDLYKVVATINDIAGKEIVKCGISFRGTKDGVAVGGNEALVSADQIAKMKIDGSVQFSAAIIGVPEGVTVEAVPFVVYK